MFQIFTRGLKNIHIISYAYAFHKESDLCSVESGTYMEKLGDTFVKNIVNENKLKSEPFAELVDVNRLSYRSNTQR